ncbi:MAG TPA: 1-acyl-sn-glycerol-3-phosphate acyltransferase [Bacilli bacterium]|nr:1-acyl-sn-glycerol-3-phosphate acyltransferase [Bacilli bacterium]HQC75054.1 1-acyl-sn-glycerol-3-phosphate acyltransferase [Bacilli bacterium]
MKGLTVINMIILIISLMAILASSLYMYFTQYLTTGIIWWSFPVLFLVFWLLSFLLFYGILAIMTLFMNPKKVVVHPYKFYSLMIAWTTRFLATFYRLDIVFENDHLLPHNSKFFLISNHQSNLDPIALLAVMKKHTVTFIMKDSLLNLPVIGPWLRTSGYLPLDRKNDRKALEVVALAIKRIKDGKALGVYPEGTRSRGPKMNEFHHGIFRVPQKAEAPIVVVAIDNLYRVKKRFLWTRTKVLIRICEVIPYEDIKNKTTADISLRAQTSIQKALDEARAKYSWLN